MIHPSNDELLAQSKDLLNNVADIVASPDITPEALESCSKTLASLSDGLHRIAIMMQAGIL
jgi:hypothetical protein